ncbi:MAG: hypothetical protein EZS28_006474 [Streblomastix strix]|uniref:Tyr recombinase domain-containing protein n=1 Tax=Streblomastix strix TaxID=222440 RepID=A0A5J4WSU4_9EUKA|nr:MAG: hypothetical protein EZS28_006474 [Streblomastix strix]
MFQDKSICSYTQFKAWWSQRDPLNPNKPEQIWKTRMTQKPATRDMLSKQIRIIMQAAGIPSSYSVTSVRTAALTKLIKAGASPLTVDRFTHHSDTAQTVRQYYDRNNNSKARQLLASSTELSIQIVANGTADQEISEDLRDDEENLLSELDIDEFTVQDQHHLEQVVQEKKTSDQENLDLENKFNMEGQLLREKSFLRSEPSGVFSLNVHASLSNIATLTQSSPELNDSPFKIDESNKQTKNSQALQVDVDKPEFTKGYRNNSGSKLMSSWAHTGVLIVQQTNYELISLLPESAICLLQTHKGDNQDAAYLMIDHAVYIQKMQSAPDVIGEGRFDSHALSSLTPLFYCQNSMNENGMEQLNIWYKIRQACQKSYNNMFSSCAGGKRGVVFSNNELLHTIVTIAPQFVNQSLVF